MMHPSLYDRQAIEELKKQLHAGKINQRVGIRKKDKAMDFVNIFLGVLLFIVVILFLTT